LKLKVARHLGRALETKRALQTYRGPGSWERNTRVTDGFGHSEAGRSRHFRSGSSSERSISRPAGAVKLTRAGLRAQGSTSSRPLARRFCC
jgi:hypothetical protein